ncbi:MAG: hypothetical protein WKI04_14945 [Ferruginibacter sp.]
MKSIIILYGTKKSERIIGGHSVHYPIFKNILKELKIPGVPVALMESNGFLTIPTVEKYKVVFGVWIYNTI